MWSTNLTQPGLYISHPNLFDIGVTGVTGSHETQSQRHPIRKIVSKLPICNLLMDFVQCFFRFSNDEYFVDAFAIFCGMGITNVMNFQAVSQANAKLKVNTSQLFNFSTMECSPGDDGRSLVPSAGNNHEKWDYE